jgi:hypothetical protein
LHFTILVLSNKVNLDLPSEDPWMVCPKNENSVGSSLRKTPINKENVLAIFKFFIDNKDKYNININKKDSFGIKPISYAIENKKDDLIEDIKEKYKNLIEGVKTGVIHLSF